MYPQLEQMRDMLYRCQFSKVLALTHSIENSEFLDRASSYFFETSLVKANALSELHRVKEAKAVLASISETVDQTFDENFLYAVARLRYLDNDYDSSQKILLTILESSGSKQHQFRALLGMANILYSRNQTVLIADVLKRLYTFEPLERDDDRIGLLLLLANYYRRIESYDTAKVYYFKAIATASKRSWIYFMQKAYFGLAMVAKCQEKNSELAQWLETLDAITCETESHYLTYLINDTFPDRRVVLTEMDFDRANSRIHIHGRWLSFVDNREVFDFLALLHEEKEFQTPERISEKLWPSEKFQKETLGKKIDHLSKKAVELIEAYENQPKILLTTNEGYKLASL